MKKLAAFFVGFATIVATVIAGIEFFNPHEEGSRGHTGDGSKTAAVDSITGNSDPTLQELRRALAAASAISYSDDHDLALQHVVRAALTSSHYELAIEAADSLSYESLHDEVLEYIVRLALEHGDTESARQAAGRIQYTSAHDRALGSVAEAINRKYAVPRSGAAR